MKQTEKYSQASKVLTFPHSSQDELYSELNRLGWFWDSKVKKWERDDRPALEESKLIKIRILASARKVEQAAELLIENSRNMGLGLLEKSEMYPCRPPNQNDARIYLSFVEVEQ